MPTFDLKKECERCNAKIPDDFGNMLCFDCYEKYQDEHKEEMREAKEVQKEEIEKNDESPTNSKKKPAIEPIETTKAPETTNIAADELGKPEFGIMDPNYKDNPEMDDKDQILANLAQFIYSHDEAKKRHGKLLWYPQRHMYTFIKNWCLNNIIKHPQYPKYIWKPNIVDVGCGSGVGTNVLSQEANFIWGIDKNAFSIEFAYEAFTRIKNNYFYSTQVTFDHVDVIGDTREFMKFEVVVSIEVIEHLQNTDAFLKSLMRFTKTDKKNNCHIDNPTNFFISSPNRNSRKINKESPQNPYHVREWTAGEFLSMLQAYFEEVELLDQKGQPIEADSEVDVVLARCVYPKYEYKRI